HRHGYPRPRFIQSTRPSVWGYAMNASMRKRGMNAQAWPATWLAWLALLTAISFPAHAVEAPGALTVIVKDRNTGRPLPAAQVTIRERQTDSTRSAETNAQGRITVGALDPGLYAVSVSGDGFAPSHEPGVRVVSRKNI